MAAVVKQDSNQTGLRYAVEVSPGVVNGSAVWQPLEPNSYKTFGGDVKTKARMPISADRQLRKAVVVDLDAQGGFQQDLTSANFQDISQSFFWAALRTKAELAVATTATSGHKYEPASGGTGYQASDLLFAKGFADSVNNGLKVVSGTPDATNVAVTDTGVIDSTGQTGIISRVGYVGGTGEFSIDVSGALPKLVSTNTAASGTLTNDGSNVTDADTVTVGGKTYTLQDTLTNVDGHVKIGASNTATMTNLFHAINASGGSPGTDYAMATTANVNVTATNPTGTTVVATAKVTGTVGDAIASTEASTHLSWGAATLTGGAGRDLTTLGIIEGEFVFIGGDASTDKFFSATDNGFCRVRAVAAGSITFDKTQNIMVADDGTSTGSGGTPLTIRLFFGRVVKNESDPSLQIKRSVQLERTLGAPDDAQPAQIQAEYLINSVANDLTVDMKTADIIRLEMDFLSNRNQLVSGSTGVKAGTRPVLADTDAFNSTSDVAFTKMAIVTAGSPCPTALFTYLTDLTINLKNNVKQNKAISVLGAFSSTAGFFQVMASVTAYFTDIAEMQAVLDNDSVTLETHLVKFNAGITMDIPLVVLGKALADVKLNEPIMIPLSVDASKGTNVDTGLNHTMLVVFWDYLPDLAG